MSEVALYSRRTDYRADIDGLRAISVIAVLGFHAGIAGFSGGFVGVDVFFVISGFLITRLLLPDATGQRPSLKEFYLRRARRIAPALALIMGTTTLVAVWLFLPWDLRMHGKFTEAASVFLANFAARANFGYFTPSDTPRALLHLWSIAVEEQFYLLYPLALFVVLRLVPRRVAWVLTAVAMISLAGCIWGSHYARLAAFFLAPSRAWELLLGALIVFSGARIPSRLVAEVLACAAVIVLAAAVISYGPQTRYPGVLAIPVCVAAALLIVTGEHDTMIRRGLSLRAVVFTGVVSYSLYLWHLPLLSFVRYYDIDTPGPWAALGLIALSYGLAVLTWRFLERPIRTRALLESNSIFTAVMVSVFAVLCVTGMLLWKSDGLPRRFTPSIQAMMDESLGYHPDAMRCLVLTPQEISAGRLCGFGPEDGVPVVVWGDSHTVALLYAYEDLAKTHGARVWLAARSSCQPVFPTAGESPPEIAKDPCLDFNRAMLAAIRRLAPRVVILNAYWINAVSGPGKYDDLDAAARRSRLDVRLIEAVRRPEFARSRICLVRDPPTLPHDASYVMAMSERRGIDPGRWQVSSQAAEMQDAEFMSTARALAARGEVIVADLAQPICGKERCDLQRQRLPLYIDTHHLSSLGAHVVTPALDRCFEPIERRP